MPAYIRGLDRLAAKLQKLESEMVEGGSEALRQGLDAIREDAQQRAPVDTGDLRDSIRVELTQNGNHTEGRVVVDVDYGMHVELGTSDMDAQPYLYPAYESNKEQIRQAIIGGVKAAVREVVR